MVPTKLALAEQFKTEVPSMAGFVDAVGDRPRPHRKARRQVARHGEDHLHRHAAGPDRPGHPGRRDGQGRRS